MYKGNFPKIISNHQHIKAKCQPTNQPTNQNDSRGAKKTWENSQRLWEFSNGATTEVTDQLNTVELDFAIPLPPAWSGGAQSGPAKGRRQIWWVAEGWIVKGQRFGGMK